MRCATRLATRYARYSLEPDARARIQYSRLRALRKRIIKKLYHAIRDLALRNGTVRLGAPISKPTYTLIVIPPALLLPLLCDRYSLHSLRARFGADIYSRGAGFNCIIEY